MQVSMDRKYKLRCGYDVEIDIIDGTKDVVDRSSLTDDMRRVLGRIFMPSFGWMSAQWKLDGSFKSDGSINQLDLVDAGPNPKTVTVEMQDAIAIKEINELCEYVTVDGVDPELFDNHSLESLQSTTARVVFDMISKVASLQKTAMG